MNNDNFLIEESNLEQARDICKDIADPQVRNRAMANALASDIAVKYFQEIEVDTETGLHRIPQVLSDIDIADIYLNNTYVDVRVYFNENELCVPKSHFDKNLLPIAYMFIKLDSELAGGVVTGFIVPSSINTSSAIGEFYQIQEDDLISYYDIEPLIVAENIEDLPENFESQIFEYLDGRLSLAETLDFYRLLLKNPEARIQLRNAANVQNIFNFISKADDIKEETTENELISDFEVSDVQELDLIEDTDSTLELVEENTIETLENFEIEEEFTDSLNLDLEQQDLLGETVVHDEAADLESTSFESELLEDSQSLDIIEEEVIEQVEELTPSEDAASNLIEELPLDASSQELDNNLVVEKVDVVTPLDTIVENDEETIEDDFSTSTTPSMGSIEEAVSLDDLEGLLEKDDNKSVVEPVVSEAVVNETAQLADIYPTEGDEPELFEEHFIQQSSRRKAPILPLLSVIAVVAALGYYGYTKFFVPYSLVDKKQETSPVVVQTETSNNKANVEEAMPVETVENINIQENTNEGNAISVPAIEQNLDASVLVSNLSINWEVPAGYVSNNTAQRYFTKIGKIIQLNLKTELLLLSKPPLTNKISLEMEFDKNNQKFVVKKFLESSGEKTIDDLISKTVKNTLDMNLKTNMSSFANIPGNPVLIIRL